MKKKQEDTKEQTKRIGLDPNGDMSVEGAAIIRADGSVTMKGNLKFETDSTFDIGTPTKKVKDIYVSSASIKMGDNNISLGLDSYDNLQFSGSSLLRSDGAVPLTKDLDIDPGVGLIMKDSTGVKKKLVLDKSIGLALDDGVTGPTALSPFKKSEKRQKTGLNPKAMGEKPDLTGLDSKKDFTSGKVKKVQEAADRTEVSAHIQALKDEINELYDILREIGAIDGTVK